ncbi:nucleotide-binding protein [Candidatus Saccharibacteria bacterium]|nr:nucleotide-binding protein [Candidatus Saccharibacteria bacterium]
MEEETTIFYSWQSDNQQTRSFIEKSLKKVIKKITKQPNLELSPRIDKDTQGEVGAVHIGETIKKKINDCGIFLADVSLVDKAKSGRMIVNQNVVFELGYAIGKKSESMVILVANSDLGDTKDLPFDIAYNRIIEFSPDKDTRGTKFQQSLEFAINAHLESLSKKNEARKVLDLKKDVLDSIRDREPTRSVSEKYFDHLYNQYLLRAPKRYSGSDIAEYKAQTYNRYIETKELTKELFQVLSMAAEYNNKEVLVIAYKHINIISKYYDVVPEDNGQMYGISKDYYELIVYEIFSIILGCVAKDKLWDLLPEIAAAKIDRPSGYSEPRTLEKLYGYPESVLNYYKELTGQNWVIPTTQLIEERFKDQKDILQAYLDGCLLAYFMVNNYPWLVGLLLMSDWQQYVPEYMQEFRKKDFVGILQKVTGMGTLEEYRNHCWAQASRELGGWMLHNDNLLAVFSREGIKTKEDIGSN